MGTTGSGAAVTVVSTLDTGTGVVERACKENLYGSALKSALEMDALLQ